MTNSRGDFVVEKTVSGSVDVENSFPVFLDFEFSLSLSSVGNVVGRGGRFVLVFECE